MRTSIAERVQVTCPDCGVTQSHVLWVAADLLERPDLRVELSGEESWSTRCQTCASEVPRSYPLLVIRASVSAPLLLGLSADLLGDEGIPEFFRSLIENVRKAMGDELRELPGPILRVPLDVLREAIRRDVDKDLRRVESLSEKSTELDRTTLERYKLFLNVVIESRFQRQVGLASNYLRSVQSLDELERIVEAFDADVWRTVGDQFVAQRESASDNEEKEYLNLQLALSRHLQVGNAHEGWLEFEKGISNLWSTHAQPRLERLVGEHDQAGERKDHKDVIRAGQEILPIARLVGMDELEAYISFSVANALYFLGGENRRERMEESIALMERSLAITDAGSEVDPIRRARIQTNLGSAYASRLKGDRLANQERATSLFRDVLSSISIEDDPDNWAMAHTNLALSLMEASVGNEANVIEAIDHLSEALRWRTQSRNPLDWAFTQLNLGLAYSRLSTGDRRVNGERSLDHHRNAALGFREAGDEGGTAQALHNLSSEGLVLAQLEGTELDARNELIANAITHAEESLELRTLEIAPEDAGRTWYQLGRALHADGRTSEAKDAYRQALTGLTPLITPADCRRTAQHLASLASEDGDWEEAARTWEVAVNAATAAVRFRSTSRGRLGESRENMNIARWAAYALTRADRPKRAVEVLEAGRARELAAWMQRGSDQFTRLRQLDPELADRYVQLRATLDAFDQEQRLGAAPRVTTEIASVAEDMQRVIDQIRALPSLERFLDVPEWADIRAGASPQRPLAFLVTAPQGSVIILVWGSSDPEIQVIEGRVTSAEIVKLLFRFDPADGGAGGYFLAQAGETDELDEEIDQLSAAMGQTLLKPLADALESRNATHVCLIPVGIAGLLPLHCLTWQQNGNRQCLLDKVNVAFSPSAEIAITSATRASTSPTASTLLVVGNPLPHSRPLAGAESEAEIVASTFQAHHVTKLVRHDATKHAVLHSMPGASHVHFACHGWSNVLEEVLSAHLSLASEIPLTASEIVDVGNFSARLVVLSACQTAIFQGYETADEVLGLATAFLGAGAAGVVATLWPVDDYPTALLMSCFYEHLAKGVGPIEALRNSQLWLRDLNAADERRYLQSHPLLRAHRTARVARSPLGSFSSLSRPYSAPSLWGAFVLTGA